MRTFFSNNASENDSISFFKILLKISDQKTAIKKNFFRLSQKLTELWPFEFEKNGKFQSDLQGPLGYLEWKYFRK